MKTISMDYSEYKQDIQKAKDEERTKAERTLERGKKLGLIKYDLIELVSEIEAREDSDARDELRRNYGKW